MNVCVCLTWSELLDAALAQARVHGQKVFEPGDLRVGDAAGCTQHGGCLRPLHHLQLGPHVDAGEAKWQQVLWRNGESWRSEITGTNNIKDSQAWG